MSQGGKERGSEPEFGSPEYPGSDKKLQKKKNLVRGAVRALPTSI